MPLGSAPSCWVGRGPGIGYERERIRGPVGARACFLGAAVPGGECEEPAWPRQQPVSCLKRGSEAGAVGRGRGGSQASFKQGGCENRWFMYLIFALIVPHPHHPPQVIMLSLL